MLDEITALCRFYADQYGMIIHAVYDPAFFVLKGHIVFRSIRKNYSIMCAGRTDKEIAGSFHSIIYDVLAEEGVMGWREVMTMPDLKSIREQWGENTKNDIDAACQTLIDLARQNPAGECWVLVRAADAETGETFQIAVKKG